MHLNYKNMGRASQSHLGEQVEQQRERETETVLNESIARFAFG